MRQRGIIALGGSLSVVAAAILVGRDRWRRALRELDRRSGLFAPHGSRLYSRLAPHLLRPLYRRIADDVGLVHAEGTVLDVGTGPGLLALEIARRQPRLTVLGMDLSPAMVAIARANAEGAGLGDRVHFETGDVAALPYGDASVDLVVSSLSLHHWPRLTQALRDIHRVLRPGGSAWLYDVPSYSLREFQGAVAQTPFGGQPVERTSVQAGPLGLPLVVRFALTKTRPDHGA